MRFILLEITHTNLKNILTVRLQAVYLATAINTRQHICFVNFVKVF